MKNRLDFPVTFFPNLFDSDKPIIKTFETLFNKIQVFKDFKKSLRINYKNNKPEYDNEKKQLPCFVIGNFKKRNKDNCYEYTPCMCFDFDKIKDEKEQNKIFRALQTLDYIYSAFYSISGLGLRVLVWTNSAEENHSTLYSQILKKLNNDLKSMGIQNNIDKQTFDLGRAWFLTPLKSKLEFFLNSESEVVSMTTLPNQAKVSSFSEHRIIPHQSESINLCLEIINNRKIDGRNNNVMQITRLASEYGIDEEIILKACLSFVDEKSSNPFTLKELKKTIKSNLKPKTRPIEELKIYHKSIIEASYKEKGKFHQIVDLLEQNFDLRFNEFSKEFEYRRKGHKRFKQIVSEDLEYFLFDQNLKGFKDMLKSIIGSNNIGKNFNPLSAYLNELPSWDPSQTDHIDALQSFVKTDDPAFFRLQFKKMIVRNLACSLNLIPFNKQVLCFLSEEQDLGKTTFLRFLCPIQLKDYYQEYMPLSDKDSYKALGNNIFINLDEIDEFKRHELNKLKSWISKDKIKIRLPFGKNDVIMPRIANFFATGNRYDMLIDTQNVRWLNFKVEHIKHDNGGKNGYQNLVNINDVYAQAFYLLNNEFEYEMTGEEKRHMEKRNKKYFSKISIEQQLIQDLLVIPKQEGDQYINYEFATSTDILNMLSNYQSSLKLSLNKVGRAMTALNFPKSQKKINNTPVKGYLIHKIY